MHRLILLRHAETQANVHGILQGSQDSPLTSSGVAAARQTGICLADCYPQIRHLCASPLGRAQTTLDIMAATVPAWRSLPRSTHPWLAEVSYGLFDGTPAKSLPADPWEPGAKLVRWGGDDTGSVRQHALTGIRGLTLECPRGDILAITHGTLISLIIRAVEGVGPNHPAHIPNMCGIVLGLEADGESIHLIERIDPQS